MTIGNAMKQNSSLGIGSNEDLRWVVTLNVVVNQSQAPRNKSWLEHNPSRMLLGTRFVGCKPS